MTSSIEALIASAQTNAAQATNTQTETVETQQAVGQSHVQQTETVQTGVQANPTAVNQNAQAQATTQTQAQTTTAPTAVNQSAPVNQSTPVVQNAPKAEIALPAGLPPELAKFLGPREMTMDTMSSSDLSVQDWVKTAYHGMTLGSAPTAIVQPFNAEIDMSEQSGFMLCQMVRWTVKSPTGDQTNYVHTFDGEMGSDGKPWYEAVMTAYNTTTDPSKPNVPYPAVQLPMRLTQNVLNPATQEVLAQEGIMVGHTTAKTGWKNWQDFYNTVKAQGLLGQRVIVEISNQAVAPKNSSYTWGVLSFKLIGAAQ